uniref:Uncharacterized protein n=1 Tax=Anopheles merus TaxID=30066 RepID=A0A182URV7_ANOME
MAARSSIGPATVTRYCSVLSSGSPQCSSFATARASSKSTVALVGLARPVPSLVPASTRNSLADTLASPCTLDCMFPISHVSASFGCSSLNTFDTYEHLACRPPPGGRSGMSSRASSFSSAPYSIELISPSICSMRARRCCSSASSRFCASSETGGAPGNAMMMMLMLSRLPLCRQVSITWFATSTRLSDTSSRLCTNWHSSSLLITSQTPSQASTRNSSAGSRSRQNISGSGDTSCSHWPRFATFL